MRVVFCGTPQFAVPSLKYLLTQPEFEIVGVITQPDRPRGRGQQIAISPIKEAALAAGLPVHQPEKARAPEVEELLRQLSPDCIVIIAYGQIIPQRLLSIPTYGWINLHASLLPKYRGAAPINWAIANGEARTGLTTIRIDAGMDTGAMLLQCELEIGAQETATELAARMAESGAPLMVETLRGIASGTLAPKPQKHTEATYAPMLKKEDGRIDWSRTAREIYNRMRGFMSWPGAYSTFRSQSCQLWGEPVSSKRNEDGGAVSIKVPGTLKFRGNRLLVACGETTELQVTAVKVEGRKRVSAVEFANGARLTEGERFGNG